jgi:Trk K+ transport system NAD-binding subunit
MTMLESSLLTARDLDTLNSLKQQGLSLIEVRISQLSIARGQLLESLLFPENTRVFGVKRNNRMIMELEAVFLEEGDTVFVLTDDEHTVRRMLTL